MKSNTQELELECQELDTKITEIRKKKMKLEWVASKINLFINNKMEDDINLYQDHSP